MLRKIADALLLRGLWKIKPIHVVMFWAFLSYQAWMGSPYFMYYVVGAPEPGTAPRHVGMLRIDGELRRTVAGWAPPRYFVQTEKGDVEFHCGYLPHKTECLPFIGSLPKFQGLKPVVVGIDPYWGVDHMELPPPYTHANGGYAPSAVSYGRELDLRGFVDSMEPIVKKELKRSKHFWASLWFSIGLLVYFLLMTLKLFNAQTSRPVRVSPPGDSL